MRCKMLLHKYKIVSNRKGTRLLWETKMETCHNDIIILTLLY